MSRTKKNMAFQMEGFSFTVPREFYGLVSGGDFVRFRSTNEGTIDTICEELRQGLRGKVNMKNVHKLKITITEVA